MGAMTLALLELVTQLVSNKIGVSPGAIRGETVAGHYLLNVVQLFAKLASEKPGPPTASILRLLSSSSM